MKKLFAAGALVLGMTGSVAAVTPADVLKTYADIAEAKYQDSLTTAQTLDKAIDALTANPSAKALKAAREAWIAARVPYQQSEVYRFGNAIVDDWEGKVNAWPLDEGLIDYVDGSYGQESEENKLYVANVIANKSLKVGGKMLAADKINGDLIRSLHEIDNVEANVATGYHAIEFLLWGQDLNGTGKGAGNRPWTDFSKAKCTGGNCERRVQYLQAASDLMIADLKDMVAAWGKGGEARTGLEKMDGNKGLSVMLTGMGSLSYGELAGERMQLGLMLHDPEEEHDCFSDNTHNSHYYDAKGIRNIYVGSYTRIDGSRVSGASLQDLVKAKDGKANASMIAALDMTMAKMKVMKDEADSGRQSYDQMIGEGNKAGNAMVQNAIDALKAQTRQIENVVATLGIDKLEFEGSDSLDNPKAVFQ